MSIYNNLGIQQLEKTQHSYLPVPNTVVKAQLNTRGSNMTCNATQPVSIICLKAQNARLQTSAAARKHSQAWGLRRASSNHHGVQLFLYDQI